MNLKCKKIDGISVITEPQPFQSTFTIEHPIESDMEKSAATTTIYLRKV